MCNKKDMKKTTEEKLEMWFSANRRGRAMEADKAWRKYEPTIQDIIDMRCSLASA